MGSDGRAGYDDAGTGTSLEGWCVQVQGQGRSCKDTQSSVAGGKVHQEEEGDRNDNVLATSLQRVSKMHSKALQVETIRNV